MSPRSRSFLALAALSMLALGGVACQQPTEETTLEFRASVSAEPVRTGSVERLLTTTGTVRARREASVVAETAGKLRIARNPETGERLSVGDEVKRGQVIASIDMKELRTSARTNSRKKGMQAAEAEYQRNLKMYEEGLISVLQLSEYETRVARKSLSLPVCRNRKKPKSSNRSGLVNKL